MRHSPRSEKLGAEGGDDELSIGSLLVDDVGDGGSVHGIEVGVDLIKEVKGRGVATLNSKDESERDNALLACECNITSSLVIGVLDGLCCACMY